MIKKTSGDLRLTFVGDILCDTFLSSNFEPYRDPTTQKLDFTSIFSPMRKMFSASDYVFANLETPISFDNTTLSKQRWVFSSPFEFAEAVKRSGINYVSTANNHCLDFGLPGLLSTLKSLDAIGLKHSGTYDLTEPRKPLIMDIQGVSVGILAYTYGTNAVSAQNHLRFKDRRAVDLIQEQEGAFAPYDPWRKYTTKHPNGLLSKLRTRFSEACFPGNKNLQWFEQQTFGWYRRKLLMKDIRWLRKHGADLIAIYLHIGGQLNTEPSQFTKETVQWLLKNGVEIIIGNHEHVIHGCIQLPTSSQLATYAIGDFLGCSGTVRPPLDRRGDYSIAVHAHVDSQKKSITHYTFSVIKVIYTSENKFEIWPVHDLLPTLSPENRRVVESNALLAAKDFSGTTFVTVLEEFPL